MFTPAIILPFFKTGPFAWNGVFVFWIPATVFGALFIVNTVWLLRAINSEAREEISAVPPIDGQAAGGVAPQVGQEAPAPTSSYPRRVNPSRTGDRTVPRNARSQLCA